MKIFLLVMIFFLMGAFFIISNENIKMNSSSNVISFLEEYFSWFDKLGSSGKGIVGYFAKMEWLPETG